MSRHIKRAAGRVEPVSCEPLDRRVLLSTINWTNKGTSTSDTDGFTASFGAVQADLARGIAQRAVDDWERIVVNFNRTAPGTNTYNVVLRALNIGIPGVLGRTGSITYDPQGKPTSATIELDNNTGDMGAWYLDPVVGPSHRPDDSEFTFIDNPFQARNFLLGSDLYRTVVHELGHAMGLASSSTRVSSIGVDIGDDPNAGGTAHLFTLDVNAAPGADYTYTNDGGFHLYEGPAVAGCPVHPDELMNAGRTSEPGQRNLISDTYATLLRDAFGYTIQMPSQQNTFYVQFNDTANSVTINGDIRANGNDNDLINVRRSTSFQVFEVNGAREDISTVEFFSVLINANLGNDIILIDQLKAGAPTTVNASAGDDALELAPTTRNLDEVPSPITFNASLGVDVVRLRDSSSTDADTYTITPTLVDRIVFGGVTLSGVERVELTAQTANNTFDVKADPATTYHFDGGGGADTLAFNEAAATAGGQYTIRNGLVQRAGFADVTYAATETVRFDAGSGNDTFTFLPGDFYPSITFHGNGGADSLLVDDRGNTGPDGYSWFGTSLHKNLVPPGTNPPITGWTGIETATFQANDDNNTIDVFGTIGTTRIFTNGGNDGVRVHDGTAIVNTGAENPSAVAPFADTLGVNLDANNEVDEPGTAIISEDDDVRDINVTSGMTVGTLRILSGAALLRSAGPGSGFSLTGVIDLAGGALLMRAPGTTLAQWRADLIAGRNGGAWNGTSPGGSVNSSLAAGTTFGDGVGYGLGSQIAPTSIGPFGIGAGDTLLHYALDGDANLDGTVNLLDFNRLATNFGQPNKVWVDGDFTYDGNVNLPDFNALAGNFGQSAAPDMVQSVTKRGGDLRELLDELT